jgi:hypothetical protein
MASKHSLAKRAIITALLLDEKKEVQQQEDE